MDSVTFSATDQDGDSVTVPHRVTGDDHEVLTFDRSNILRFIAGHEPDYEEQSSYSITITARSRARSTTLDVTIEVVDTEDPGEVSLSQRHGQVGIDIYGTAGDPDGGVSIKQWVWERSAEITVDEQGTPSAECLDDPRTTGIGEVGGWTTMDRATSAVYTPGAG